MNGKAIVLSAVIAVVVIATLGGAFSSTNLHSGNSNGAFLNDAVMLGISSSSSLNWAGYVITGSDITNVTGSFTVPSLAVSAGPNENVLASGHGNAGLKPGSKGTTYAAFWAGIDGYSSSTVEQAGVLMEDSGGVVTYNAWYEFYPAAPVYAGWSPSPGNNIIVTVVYDASNNTMTANVTDVSTGQYFQSPYESASSYQRNSAEWIAEAPSSGRGILPLADFGTVYFGVDNTGVSNTNYATVNGTYGSIGTLSDTLTVYSVSMVNRNGSLKAVPSALSSDGTSFSVTWYSS